MLGATFGKCFALEIASLLAKKILEAPVRKYGLGNTVLWMASCTRHGLTLRLKVLLGISVRQCYLKSPLEINVRRHRSESLGLLSLHPGLPCNVHGYERFHISIYIYIYMYI